MFTSTNGTRIVLTKTKEVYYSPESEDAENRTQRSSSNLIPNYGGLPESKMFPPFLRYAKSTDCGSYANRGKYLGGEFADFENAAQVVTYAHSMGRGFKTSGAKYLEKTDEVTEKPSEKEMKEDSYDEDDTNNGKEGKESYWERRRKNNASAKKSRDARKFRELQTQLKAAFLERENLRMRTELMIILKENACLKRVLCAKMI